MPILSIVVGALFTSGSLVGKHICNLESLRTTTGDLSVILPPELSLPIEKICCEFLILFYKFKSK